MFIIAGERELGEEYLCELITFDPMGHGSTTSPIVRVMRVLRYPDQRAIIWPDVANEVCPIREGTICRLPYIRSASSDEISRYPDWASSLIATQAEAMNRAASDAERRIIRNHQLGLYIDRRAVHTYTDEQALTYREAH
jgi:hypothetical protein